ncbi:MAG: SHOCT domain-containing protein, partial [Acidimicrobiia bacterium]
AVMVVADADNDAWFDHMGGWAGWWVIFPIVMMIFMVLMMSRMFFSRHDSSGGGSGMMGMMGGHGGENQTTDDSALEVLGRRYAAGELTGEEFDAMRRRLESG